MGASPRAVSAGARTIFVAMDLDDGIRPRRFVRRIAGDRDLAKRVSGKIRLECAPTSAISEFVQFANDVSRRLRHWPICRDAVERHSSLKGGVCVSDAFHLSFGDV